MKVLVTGGACFIGLHAVDKLRRRRVEVRVYDTVTRNFRKDIEHYRCGILSLEGLRMAMNRVDAVFHLAAIADVNAVFEGPYY